MEKEVVPSSQAKKMPQILFLNGPSSSGKSSLARFLQQQLPSPYLHFGLDKLIGMMPKQVNDWSGKVNPSGFSWKASRDNEGYPIHVIRMGPYAEKVMELEMKVAHTIASAGLSFIIDDVILSKEKMVQWRDQLAAFDVLWIGLKVPLAVLEERERKRDDNRIIGSARDQYYRVHEEIQYDVELDTSLLNLSECFERIHSFILNR